MRILRGKGAGPYVEVNKKILSCRSGQAGRPDHVMTLTSNNCGGKGLQGNDPWVLPFDTLEANARIVRTTTGDTQNVNNAMGNPMKTAPARSSVHNGIKEMGSPDSGSFRLGFSVSKATPIWPPTSTLLHVPCPMSPLPVIAPPSGVEKVYPIS
jgi:hypothetical protein